MRAALLRELPATRLDVADIPEPRVEHDGDVVVEVEACGICGTDLHILAGTAYRPALPFVLGHEPVGRVLGAGSSTGEWIGRRVTATLFEGCGSCARCAAGDERLCPQLRSVLGVLGPARSRNVSSSRPTSWSPYGTGSPATRPRCSWTPGPPR